MEEAARANNTGRHLEPRALQTIKNHSIEHECVEKSHVPIQHVDVNINNNTQGRSDADVVPAQSNIKNGACTIPGVEHVFFEKELEKMEHHVLEGQVVVLAVDSSKPSEVAFKCYADQVNRPGYVLHVVHHSNCWSNLESLDGGPSPKHCQELMVKEEVRVKEVEEKYKKLMADNHVTGEFIVLQGKDTWHDIIQYQEKVHAIMIVIGTRGQNSLRRTFMGSVSDSVVHHASCPVLVCCHHKN